jgi:hypothetical protein
VNTPTNIMTPDIDLCSVWGMFISPINSQAHYLLSNASIPDIRHFAACNLPFCVPEVRSGIASWIYGIVSDSRSPEVALQCMRTTCEKCSHSRHQPFFDSITTRLWLPKRKN